MSVLITGFGTVGAAVALVFADSGYDVVVYSSEQNSPRTRLMLDGYGDSINMVPGDIRHLSHIIDIIKKNDVEGVIHTAALTLRSSALAYPDALLSVNTFGTYNVLEAARVMNLERVVFTSSGSVLGQISKTRIEPFKEDEPLSKFSSNSFYDVSKYMAELLVDSYNRVYGMETVTARIQWVYGIGEKNPRDIGRFLYSVLEGKEIMEESGGEITADYSYNKDVAEGLRILYTSKKIESPRIYNISSGMVWRLADIVDLINEMGPGKVTIGQGIGGRFAYLKDSIRRAPFDINRAKGLGYRSTPLREALEDYANWMREKNPSVVEFYG